MLYSELAKVYEKIEGTTKRLEMTDYLVELFKATPNDLIDKVTYLTQGKLYPDFVGIELGIADKLTLKAIAFASGFSEEEIDKAWKKSGDLGTVVYEFISKKRQMSLYSEPLTVSRVYSNFEGIAKATGQGSQDLKIKLVADLLHDSTPLEAKYIIRTVTGKLRLGIADMTILDAFAIAFAEKKDREEIERAYNVYSDLGKIAETIAREGLEGLNKFSITLGIPIKSMLAERLSSIDEIFKKLGKCAFEYKYDGLRIQAHLGESINLFSRHMENITDQFPDVVDALKKSFKGNEAIVEGECVPININTGELLPFQEVSHRRGRKYDVEEAVEDYPVVTFLFDCLYSEGEDLTMRDYLTRRRYLKEIMEYTEKVRFSECLITDKKRKVEEFFHKSINDGCEGLIAKSIKEDSFYRAGARGWQWIKFKRDYKSEMTDTVDLVVVGAFAGKGRRKGSYGALLMASYNPDNDTFETVCKLGSGFDDTLLENLPKLLERFKIEHKHPRVNSQMKADYWFTPSLVMEVLGAEITLSPIHTCGYSVLKENAGLAVRFPRFTNLIRKDKAPEDATTVHEIIEMYKNQLKKVD